MPFLLTLPRQVQMAEFICLCFGNTMVLHDEKNDDRHCQQNQDRIGHLENTLTQNKLCN